MEDHLWPTEVSEGLSRFLSGTFSGVTFQADPFIVHNVLTIDVAWTDGPALHEVDLVALQFILSLHLDTWGTFLETDTRIDRISKRRTLSPAAEEMLMKILADDLGTASEQPDTERLYSLPPVLASSRYRPKNGTFPELLDLLFEATSFSGAEVRGEYAGGPDTLLCRCTLCG